jgi:ABC-2 type transport system permease protein
MTGWLATAADYNPVTYLLAGMRTLILQGWDAAALGQAFLASGIVGAISFTLAFTALRGRVHRK